MEVDGAAPLYDMGDGILTAMTNSDMILRAIWFPFAAIWWMITNMFSLPYMVTSWMMLGSVWIISLPFMTVSWLVYFCLAPFRYLFGWVWIPWPWTWSLSGIIDTIGVCDSFIYLFNHSFTFLSRSYFFSSVHIADDRLT